MSMAMQTVLAWLGQLGLTVGAAAVAAYGLFRWLGQKWIEAQFARELVALRAAADKELEAFRTEKIEQRDALNRDFQRETDRLKAEVGRLTDRASQLHRREYEALPEAWGLLNKAFGRVMEASRSGAIYPHFDTKDPEALSHFIDGEDLADYQKARLKSSETWYADYTKMRNSRAVMDAWAMVSDFNNFIILNGVFFEEALLEKMRQARELIAGANEKRWAVLEEINEPGDAAAAKDELVQAARLVDEIKLRVRSTLFETGLAPTTTVT